MQTGPITSSPPFVQESGNLVAPALLVNGGAGTFERLSEEGARARLEAGLASALAAGWRVFERGGAALLAVVEAVASLEDGGMFNAGRGSATNSEGMIEMDASVMDGATRAAGGVCATSWPANPVRAALAVARLTRSDTTTIPLAAPLAASRRPGLSAPTAGRTGSGSTAWHPCSLPAQVPTGWLRRRALPR